MGACRGNIYVVRWEMEPSFRLLEEKQWTTGEGKERSQAAELGGAEIAEDAGG